MKESVRFVIKLTKRDKQIPEIVVDQHLEFLRTLKKDGKLFAAGYFEDNSGGMIILSVNSHEEAEAIVKKDPFVVEEAEDFQIWKWIQTF